LNDQECFITNIEQLKDAKTLSSIKKLFIPYRIISMDFHPLFGLGILRLKCNDVDSKDFNGSDYFEVDIVNTIATNKLVFIPAPNPFNPVEDLKG